MQITFIFTTSPKSWLLLGEFCPAYWVLRDLGYYRESFAYWEKYLYRLIEWIDVYANSCENLLK